MDTDPLPARQERRLAAIVAADVEGYSRLMGLDEPRTMAMLTERRAIAHELITRHQGRVVDTAGDSILAEFASAFDAVECVLEVQRAIAECNRGIEPAHQMRLRIGVHLGDVLVKGRELFGDGVNIAARLQALADAGGVCISSSVRDQVRKKLPISFIDLGPQSVKNIAEPLHAFKVCQLEIAGSESAQSSSVEPKLVLPERPSIAVLSFDNMSPGEDLSELCLGLPESVITGLSHLRWLSVAARNSSFAAIEAGRDMAKLAQQLGVRYLLEGSVQKRGPQLRVTAQLIDARDGSHLWAKRYDNSGDDLFALQDELTQKIVAAIEQTLVTEVVRFSAHADNLAEAPLRRANRLHRSLERQDSADAQQLLRQLIASPNASVAAYQLLANTLEVAIDCFWAQDPAAAAAEALVHAQKAIQLAPLDYLSNYVLGRALLHLRRYDLAIAAARRSVELNPNSGTSLGGLGGVLAFSGDAAEAAAISERGFRLSPPEPYTALWIWYAAIAALRLQQFETALAHAEAGILTKPGVATGHLLRAHRVSWLVSARGCNSIDARGQHRESVAPSCSCVELHAVPSCG
jgi:adenylate cyclase